MQSHSILSVEQIISQAANEICSLANSVGIDGAALLSQLPYPGTLMKGRAVPVLKREYNSRCSVLFYLNCTMGIYWPFLRFFTFKNGGVSTDFNGWEWLKSSRHITRPLQIQTPVVLSHHNHNQIDDDKYRFYRDQELQADYATYHSIDTDHAWVKRRFPNTDMNAVLSRCYVRANKRDLLMPLTNVLGQHLGFQKIDTVNGNKHTYACKSGSTKGAFGLIKAETHATHLPPMICEGLATGLSLATAWTGTVLIALSANNLQPVRTEVEKDGRYRQAIFAYDNDAWKPNVGNTGLNKAFNAMQPSDLLVGPYFPPELAHHRPTDFNDLHNLMGVDAVTLQMEALWHAFVI